MHIVRSKLCLQEYFRKLKFNYIELYTKKRFLELLPDQDQWKLEGQTESEKKQQFKKIKETNHDIVKQIQTLSREIADLYEQFQNSRSNLVSELQRMKETKHESEVSQDLSKAIKRAKVESSMWSGAPEKRDAAKSEPLSPRSANALHELNARNEQVAKLQKELESLSGVCAITTVPNALHLTLRQPGLEDHKITFEFFTESTALKDVKVKLNGTYLFRFVLLLYIANLFLIFRSLQKILSFLISLNLARRKVTAASCCAN